MIIADGSVRQSHRSPIQIYSGAPATAAGAGIRTVARTVVRDSDLVEDHIGGLTLEEITTRPYPAGVAAVATVWSTITSGLISGNGDAREC